LINKRRRVTETLTLTLEHSYPSKNNVIAIHPKTMCSNTYKDYHYAPKKNIERIIIFSQNKLV